MGSDLVLTHARIYASPTAQPLNDGTVVIRDGQIVDVGPSAKVKTPGAPLIDCTGMTVTAGLWNSHVHIFTVALLHADKSTAKQLSSALELMLTRWGFTTVFDIGSILANTNILRQRIARGEVVGPRILTTGEPFFPKDGVPIYIQGFLKENHIALPDDQSTEQAVDRVRAQIHDGADGIKIFAGSIEPGTILNMPVDRAKAIVAEAHRLGKPVFAHPSNEQGVEVSMQSGVDILAHVTSTGAPWTPPFVERMRAAHLALIPTLTLFDVEAIKENLPKEAKEKLIDSSVARLEAYSRAGGEILFGTDVGYTDHFDTEEEYRLMSRAGMTFAQILASLTTNPALRFGAASHSGRIFKGLDADLAVFESDPASNIGAFSQVRYTIRAGKVIYKAS